MGRPRLSAHEIVRTIGTRTILHAVSHAVGDHSASALIGPNGSGKSTLMRILACELEPDGGRVVRSRGVAVLYLPQLDATDDARPVRAVLHERLGVAGAATALQALQGALADWPGALVVATHDARLRDRLELDVVVDLGADAVFNPH